MANFSIAFGQHRDYTKIKFKSKLRSYSKTLPDTRRYDITKAYIEDIINLLTQDLYSEKEKKELTNRIWLALSNPKNFDFIYKDYSINTIKNWGKKIKFEDPNFEPNPYLAEWTKNGNSSKQILKGGSYKSEDFDAKCSSVKKASKGSRKSTYGYRCCSNLK